MHDVRAVRAARCATRASTLAHGGGGKAMHDLIDDVFVRAFDNPVLDALEDQARLPLAELTALGDRLAFTTDSYVVDPLFFPGGDIGRLAVCRHRQRPRGRRSHTALSVCARHHRGGSRHRDLCAASPVRCAATADEAGVALVTGDTKSCRAAPPTNCSSIPPGSASSRPAFDFAADKARPGDAILVNGTLGDHGAAILQQRTDLALDRRDRQRLRGR